MNFARPLYQAGLLSREPEKFNGQEIIPYDLVLRHLPPAPKTEDEIRQILNEGLISDDGTWKSVPSKKTEEISKSLRW